VASAAATVATAITLLGGNGDEKAPDYRKAIAGICTQLDRVRAQQPARDRRLRKGVAHARTLTGQRNALLEEYKRDIAIDSDAVGRLEALTPPDGAAERVQRATVKVWTRSLRRRQRARDDLADAGQLSTARRRREARRPKRLRERRAGDHERPQAAGGWRV